MIGISLISPFLTFSKLKKMSAQQNQNVDLKEQDKSSDIEQQPPFGDRKDTLMACPVYMHRYRTWTFK